MTVENRGRRREGGDAWQEPGNGDAFAKFKAAWQEAITLDVQLSHFAARLGFVIGIHLNRKTREAFPGQARLAEQLGATRRGVQGGIDQLVERGHLAVIPSANRKGGNHYRPLLKEVSPSSPEQPDSPDEASSHANGCAHEKSSHANGGAHDNGSHVNGHSTLMRTAVRPNLLSEPFKKEAAPQPARGNSDIKIEKRERAAPMPEPDQVVDRQKTLDATWAGIVGPKLADQLGDTQPLHRAIAAGDITAEDVAAGIRDGLAKGKVAPTSWGWFTGWARGAAKARAAGRPAHSTVRDELAAFAPPPAGIIEFPGGFRRSEEAVVVELKRFAAGHPWNESVLGFPPDSPWCSVPTSTLAAILPMVELKNGRPLPHCAAERAASDFRSFHGRDWLDDYFGSPPGNPGCLLPDDFQAQALRPRDPVPIREEVSQNARNSAKFG